MDHVFGAQFIVLGGAILCSAETTAARSPFQKIRELCRSSVSIIFAYRIIDPAQEQDIAVFIFLDYEDE